MGKVTVVLGAQWGDEGKGKIVDRLAESHPVAVRFNGGANAGHTIEAGGEKTVLHLLPSNVTRAGAEALVGPGVVCDPEVLGTELAVAGRFGSSVLLDRSAPVVLPIHKQLDALREKAAGAKAIGTTRRGIGPCYEDLVARRGPKLGDLASAERFAAALSERGWFEERRAVVRHLGGEPMTAEETAAWAMRFRDLVRPRLGDVRARLEVLRRTSKDILLEGAQGVLLDVLHGSWPDCTSSYCTAGGAAASLGIRAFDRVIGVAKAYCTRVGSGPFPTELCGLEGDDLRTRGNEFGATTGRPRRCGWLDLVALRYAARVGGVSELCVTKLDVLSGMGDLKACIAYEFERAPLGAEETLTRRVLHESSRIYKALPGWDEDLSGIRRIADLPEAARGYLAEIERATGVPVTMVGVGPGREALAD